MSETNYSRLAAELKNIQSKASNAHLRVFGNKVNAFAQKANAIVTAHSLFSYRAPLRSGCGGVVWLLAWFLSVSPH